MNIQDCIVFNNFAKIIEKNSKLEDNGITFINPENGDVFISNKNMYLKLYW